MSWYQQLVYINSMATVAQLVTFLEQIHGDVRRKNSDVRQSIERALAEASKLDKLAVVSSNKDTQTLLCFPFLLALSSNNSKLVASSLACFPTLISSHTLPESLALDLLQAIYKNDVATMPMESQLKVLQIVPGLMLSYSIHNQQFLLLVDIISSLMGSSNPALSNTASAALQQVFTSLFDDLSSSTENPDENTDTLGVYPHTDSEKPMQITVSPLDLQCYKVFLDLSLIVSGESPDYFDPNVRITPQLALEIIENVISIKRDAFDMHPELTAVLRSKTVPALLGIIKSSPFNFPLTTRALRIAHLIISTQLRALESECESFLVSSINTLHGNNPIEGLTPASSPTLGSELYPTWMKMAVLEMYRTLFNNFDVVRSIYETFDKKPHRINAVSGMLHVLDDYLQKTNPIFFSNTVVQNPGPDESPSQHLSKLTSSLRISLLDHLDKQDPPSTLPLLYPAHIAYKLLITFCDRVSEFVSTLSANSNSESLEVDVEFITTFNENLFPRLVCLFKKFIFCSLDSDYFSIMIRSLQRYAHAVGLLGIVSIRDSLLSLLSDCIVKNRFSEPDSSKQKSSASNLIAFGESIVESISSTIQTPLSPYSSQSPQFESNHSQRSSVSDEKNHHLSLASRRFTSRQVICYRALANLAISLGLTLQNSWRIVLVTMQWVDYFLNGPDEYSGLANNKELKTIAEPKLAGSDILSIETSQRKLVESIQTYQADSYSDLVHVIASIYPKTDGEASRPTCPFNEAFFVRYLVTVLKANPSLILLQDNALWNFVVDYFTRISCDRSVAHNVRQFYVTSFNDVILTVTNEGFGGDDEKLKEITTQKALNAFIAFLNKLFELGKPQELLILNCETELQLIVLSTLRNLIDEFDRYFQNSWGLVFDILNSAFQTKEEHSTSDKKLFEKRRLLVSTSFDTLKLILDQFLSSLPPRQLKTLIDTLMNFCCQQYDLNISFTSVSHFWLISDTIKSSMDSLEPSTSKSNKDEPARDLAVLEQSLEHSQENSPRYYVCLNTYLLAQISSLSTDQRPQVREGATQTLFQILDTHDHEFSSWEMIYSIVLPRVLSTELSADSDLEKRLGVISSMNIVLAGVVAVINKYMLDFDKFSQQGVVYRTWKRVLEYFNDLLALRWQTLDIKVFQSFQDLIMPLPKKQGGVPKAIADLVFQFWTDVVIEYDFLNPDYQDSLATFILAFRCVYPIVELTLSVGDAKKVLSTMNKCARYPVLKQNQNDGKKMTYLQKAVMDGVALLLQKDDEKITSVVLQQSCDILSYPFETRAQIEGKIKARFEGKLKIPTFAAVSEEAFLMMLSKVRHMKDLNALLEDEGLHSLMVGLTGAVKNKARGKDDEENPLWFACSDFLCYLVERLMTKHLLRFKHNSVVWEDLVGSIFVCLEESSSDDEGQMLKQFDELSLMILPVLFEQDTAQKPLVNKVVHKLYEQSYLYKQNLIEQEMTQENTSAEELIEIFTLFEFEECFGTTAPVELYEMQDIRFKCLQMVFEMAASEDESSVVARSIAVARALFAFRRIIGVNRVTYRKPLAKVYEEELWQTLQGLMLIQEKTKFAKSEEFRKIFRLLPRTIAFVGNIDGCSQMVEKLCCEETAA